MRLLGALSGAALAVGLLPISPASAEVTAADVEDICPAPGQVDAFTDDTLNTFEDRINCAAAYDLVEGKTATTFDPQGFLTRGQAATILVNYVEVSDCDVELDTDDDDDFTDVDGNVHEDNIQKAADNGIVNGYNDDTFRPNMLISRAQFATMAVQATEVALGEDLESDSDSDFDDIEGNVHEDNIEKAFDNGMLVGTSPRMFSPDLNITRGQATSIVIGAAGQILFPAGEFCPAEGGAGTGFETLTVSPAGPTTVECVNGTDDGDAADDVTITVTDLSSTEMYRLTLVDADNVSTESDGDTTFVEDADTGLALAGMVDAQIISVNGAAPAMAGQSVGAVSPVNGQITFVIDCGSAESIVPVVYTDQGGDNTRLNLDANGQPTEPFGIGGTITFTSPGTGGMATTLNLTPEEAVNPAGTDHTVTATLTNAGGTASADGELVRFEVYGEPQPSFPPIGGSREARFFETGDVVEVVGGVATFTFTDNGSASQNPNAGPDATNASAEDYIIACVVQMASDNCVAEQQSFLGENDYLVVDSITGEPINVDQDPNDFATKDFEEREAATVTVTPESDVNVLNDTHVLTATVLDQFGDPVEDEVVRLDVFRDIESDNAAAPAPASDVGFVFNGTESEAGVTDDDGVVEFTTTSAVEASDLYIVCIDSDDDDDTVAGDEDRCTEIVAPGTALDALTADEITAVDEDDASDTATKEWVEAVAAISSLTPADATNPVGEPHTVTATVVDQFGDPLQSGDVETVTFEVFERDENGDFSFADPDGDAVPSRGTGGTVVDNQGTATDTADDTTEVEFMFTSALGGDFTIVACIDTGLPGNGECAEVDINGDLVLDEDDQSSATAQKTFVALDATPDNGTRSGEVVGDPVTTGAGGSFNLFTGDEFLVVDFEADDLFRLEGVAVTEAEFEAQLSDGDSVTVTLNDSPDPDARNTLDITNNVDVVVGADVDNDTVADAIDNCPTVSNTDQADLDGDGLGDLCDPDADGDGVLDVDDAFPLDPTESVDTDGDGVGNNSDNCPTVANTNQLDTDVDGIGDACETVAPAPTASGTAVDADGDGTLENGDEFIITFSAPVDRSDFSLGGTTLTIRDADGTTGRVTCTSACVLSADGTMLTVPNGGFPTGTTPAGGVNGFQGDIIVTDTTGLVGTDSGNEVVTPFTITVTSGTSTPA